MAEHNQRFVIELEGGWSDESQALAGRVEHLGSGVTERFRSLESLVAFLRASAQCKPTGS